MKRQTFAELRATGALTYGDGYRTKASELATSGYRIVRAGDVNHGRVVLGPGEFVSEEFAGAIGPKAVRLGDIALTTKGTIGRIAEVTAEPGLAVYSPQICYFRVPRNDLVDRRFLRFWLSGPSARRQIDMYANSTDMAPYLSLSDLARLQVELPPVSEQRAIGEVLGALDDKIAANRTLIGHCDDLIRALVLPSCSEEHRFMATIDITFGEPFGGASFSSTGEGRPLIRIRDLKSQQCQVWTTEARPREHVVSPGEVLVGMDAEFRPARWAGPRGVLNQRVLRASSERLGDALVREVIREPLAFVESYKPGTTVAHLNKADLETLSVSLPPADQVDGLRRVVDPLYTRATAAEQEIPVLAATRDELLPLLMHGRITVKSAEKTVEGVL